MALGDGTTWDETTPTNATVATQIDDYNVDLRKAVRSRMALEHEWPASQSATSEAGKHTFITLQEQAAKPTIAGTQLGAVYIKTSASGEQELFFEDEAGTEVQITSGAVLNANVAGHTIQILDTGYTTVTSGATAIPYDDSIPQTGEGNLIMQKAITPSDATNVIRAHAVAYLAGTSDNPVTALFINTTADAKAVGCESNYYSEAGNALRGVTIDYQQAAGTTAELTFYIRAGASAGGFTLNGVGGARKYGGAIRSSLTLYEIKG